MFALLAALLCLQEEKGVYVSAAGGEETWRLEVVEDRLVGFSTLRLPDGRSDAVLTLAKKDFRPLLYAVVRGKDELRLEWKGNKVRCEVRKGGKDSVREIAVPADAGLIDEAHPSHLLPLLRRHKPGKHKVFSAATLSVVDLEIGESRVTVGAVSFDIVRRDDKIVRIDVDGTRWSLKGFETAFLLRRPKAEGPVPAVVLVADDEAFAAAIADGLVGEGIAAVVSRDVRGAIDFLRARADVDAARIAILGHGEAGVLVPAAADAKVRGLLLLAVPSRPLEDVLIARIDAELRAAGTSDEQRAEILDAQRKQLRAIRDSREDGLEIDGRRTDIRAMRERLRRDPAREIAAFAGRIAILHGANDAVIGPEHVDGFLEALPNRDVIVGRFDDLDHRFARDPGEAPDAGFMKFLAEAAVRILK